MVIRMDDGPLHVEPDIVPASLSRDYRDLVGPPTAPVVIQKFLDESSAVRNKASAALGSLTARLRDSSAQTQVEDRCSVQPIADESSKIHGDIACRSELERIATLKQITSMGRTNQSKRSAPHLGDSATPGTPGTPNSHASGNEEGNELLAELRDIVPEAMAHVLQHQKTAQKTLRILQPMKELKYYLRKSHTTDYNALTIAQMEPRSETRQELPGVGTVDPLSKLVYTLKFTPTARASKVTIDTNAKRPIPFPPRQQIMHVLGSTTLAEVRDACKLGGDNVPQIDDAPDSPSSSEDSGDEDQEDPDAPRVKRRRTQEKKQERLAAARELGLPRWTQARRDTGCAFAIDGKLYADGRGDVTNYADMIMQLIDTEPSWPAQPIHATDGRHRRSAPVASLTMVPGSLALKEPSSSVAVPFDPHELYVKADLTIQEARIGNLDLRVGQPYWYIHQGNCEHIWTIEEIRHLHSQDPIATDPGEAAHYPRTTFLSRGLALSKCRLCDLSPGEIITLNDDLAGDTPALLCRICYDLLHVDAHGEEDDTVTVPVIYER